MIDWFYLGVSICNKLSHHYALLQDILHRPHEAQVFPCRDCVWPPSHPSHWRLTTECFSCSITVYVDIDARRPGESIRISPERTTGCPPTSASICSLLTAPKFSTAGAKYSLDKIELVWETTHWQIYGSMWFLSSYCQTVEGRHAGLYFRHRVIQLMAAMTRTLLLTFRCTHGTSTLPPRMTLALWWRTLSSRGCILLRGRCNQHWLWPSLPAQRQTQCNALGTIYDFLPWVVSCQSPCNVGIIGWILFLDTAMPKTSSSTYLSSIRTLSIFFELAEVTSF